MERESIIDIISDGKFFPFKCRLFVYAILLSGTRYDIIDRIFRRLERVESRGKSLASTF